MRRTHWLLGGLAATALGGGVAGLSILPRPVAADPAPAADTPAAQPPATAKVEVNLPIRQVVLFNSGIGYFQREGAVEGDARVDLSFPVEDINDLIKSLILQDMGGGQISAVSYDSRDPIERTLQSYAINLNNTAGLSGVLKQARGEKVEVSFNQPTPGQPATLSGSIIGVEMQKVPGGKDGPIDAEVISLWCADGMRSFRLNELQRIRFLNPALESEVRKALEVLTTAHDSQKKAVSLSFTGAGKRPVKVGYVIENPVWKTSYRLVLGKEEGDQPFLQGWAVVENPSDEDWSGVRMALVSGRPISFKMDLYAPLYVPRPTVEPELFASLRPPTYSGAMNGQQMAGQGRGGRAAGGDPKPSAAPMAAGGAVAAEGAAAARDGASAGFRAESADRRRAFAAETGKALAERMDLSRGVASAANAEQLGDSFQYVIEHPVNLPRQKSALLPIVTKPVEGQRVSIYNPGVHAKFPLLGLRFKNTTGMPLTQGPVTVMDGSVYAGDARLPDLQPGEDRLLAFAVDLGTEVQPVQEQPNTRLVSVKVRRGIIETGSRLREERTYRLANRSDKDRVVLIEHPFRQEFHLVPEQKVETSREVYRFPVTVKAKANAELKVVEERDLGQQVAITNSDDNTLRFFASQAVATPALKAALAEAGKRKEAVAVITRELQHTQQQLREISDDQARLRANIKEVPQGSAAAKRYVEKFDTQETEIEKLQMQIKELQAKEFAAKKAFEDYLVNLNVD